MYSLGAILYEILTHRPPFTGAITNVLENVRKTEPTPPSRVSPFKVDKDLETICLKCLQKSPHDRYASADAMADDLERYTQGIPIAARPVGRIERGARWLKRHPLAASAAGSMFLLEVIAATSIFNLVSLCG